MDWCLNTYMLDSSSRFDLDDALDNLIYHMWLSFTIVTFDLKRKWESQKTFIKTW